MQVKYLLFPILILALQACRMVDVDNPFPDGTQEYFPLRIGSFITYQVDSIVFDDAPGGNSKDTITFQLKEEIAGSDVNQEGDTVYYLHRYRRQTEADSWNITDAWTTTKNSAEALRTEENLTFNKLSFPLRFGKRWPSTSYIHPETIIQIGTENLKVYQDWEAEILSFDKAGTIGTISFPEGQVMVMNQTDSDDGIMRRFVQETYVRHIGMVSRYDEILDSRCIDLGDFGPCIGKQWVEHASKGYVLSQVMIDYE